MKERKPLNINEIDRDFFVKGPVQVVCKAKDFNRWCTLPYPDHKNGCPNFGKFEKCPPFSHYFLDVYRPTVYLAFMWFNFGEYLGKKRELHPDWTLRALINPRHFQEHLDSKLRVFTCSKLTDPTLIGFYPVFNPEGMGVNLHQTAQIAGVKLEWPPRKDMYRIALFVQPK